ncbi:MAG: hypothetical protein QNK30_10565 [Bacteroidales bacterium]|nr:hypothetical protein [Bacteroidales bacterium]
MKRFIQQTAFILILFIASSFNSIFAQDTEEKPTLETGTIQNQFDYIITKSNRYEEYKVVKDTWLRTLKSHVLDTLKNIKQDLLETQTLESANRSEIKTLKTELDNTNEKLSMAIEEKNSIKFIGTSMTKGSYNSLMWTIILGLFGTLAVFVFLFKRSNSVTSETKKTLNETKDEFESFRRRTVDREAKIVRELHDEMNKLKSELDRYKN